MRAWTEDELARVGGADELRITSRDDDGRLRRPRTIWVVREGGDLFARSVNGPGSSWYRGTRDRLAGNITAGGVDADVVFEDADHGLDDRIDAAYRGKYGASSSAVERITSPTARSTTLRLRPDES